MPARGSVGRGGGGGGFRGGFVGRGGGFNGGFRGGFFNRGFSRPLLPYYFYQAGTYPVACTLDANMHPTMQATVRSVLASGNAILKQQMAATMTVLGFPLAAGCLSQSASVPVFSTMPFYFTRGY